MKTSFLSFGVMLWFLACSNGSGTSADSSMPPSKDMATPSYEESQASGAGTDEATVDLTAQKIIRNGSMTIKVSDAIKMKAQVDALLKKHKAYIGNEQLDNSDYMSSYHIQIRLPAESLDALVADLESLDGQVTYKSINATDVTEEYIDLETRLTNKRSYLEQYRTLIKTARTVEDILKVKEQIRVLEEEIESVEGRLKYLSNQVSLSTLDLTLTQEKDYVFRPDRNINFFERLKESLSGGWFGFVTFTLSMFQLWPFWILLALLIWLIRKYNRRIRAKKTPPTTPI
ncbi:MAG: DUF4349 domain-containing protein [Bacteroidota bacterium]|nr:DUF4349 domain-containing protein [Bacteroidota bacterium]